MADAYAAAAEASSPFKMFLSLDFSVWPCSTWDHAATVVDYIAQFAKLPAQAVYKGRPLVSTFLGSQCSFGQGGDWNRGWDQAVRKPLLARGVDMHFVPVIFDDTSSFKNNYVME